MIGTASASRQQGIAALILVLRPWVIMPPASTSSPRIGDHKLETVGQLVVMDAVGVEDLDRHRVDPGLEAVGGDVDAKAGACRGWVVGCQRGVGAGNAVDAWEVELAVHPG